MKVLCVGALPETVMKAEAAVRLRWPDARIIVPGNANNALQTIKHEDPNIVLFQPGPDTWTIERFVEMMRAFSNAPLVVMESNAPSRLDEVQALEAGADDYLRQSASLVVFAAHLVALLRRARSNAFPLETTVVASSLPAHPATMAGVRFGDGDVHTSSSHDAP